MTMHDNKNNHDNDDVNKTFEEKSAIVIDV